jgi:hypothetical protein
MWRKTDGRGAVEMDKWKASQLIDPLNKELLGTKNFSTL